VEGAFGRCVSACLARDPGGEQETIQWRPSTV
jgi:hypothetical protein